MAAEITERNHALETGRVQELFDNGSRVYDVTADGQRFIVVEDAGATE